MRTAAIILVTIMFLPPLYSVHGHARRIPLNLSAATTEFLKRSLAGDASGWWIRNVTSGAKWVRGGELFWLADERLENSVVLYKTFDGDEFILNDSTSVGERVAGLITHDGDFEQWKGQPLAFAEDIKVLLADPRSYVGSSVFWARNEADLDDWLRGKSITRELFKKYCEDPQLETHGQAWQLTFHLFTPNGGLSHVCLKGGEDPFIVDTVEVRSVIPAGSLYFPDEM